MNKEELLKKLKDLLDVETERQILYLRDWHRAVDSKKSSSIQEKNREEYFAQDGVVKGIELAIQEIE